MVNWQDDRRYILISVVLHVVVLLALIISFEFSSPPLVLENSQKETDVIKAVVVDSMLQPVIAPAEPKPQVTPPHPQKQQEAVKPPVPPKVIPIQKKAPEPDKIALEKPKKMQPDLIEQQLLADLKKQTQQHKKIKQHKALENAFEKELQEQAAKALQQQLSNEQKKLADKQSRISQGLVDKYKALILQAIGRRWLVPANINRNLTSELMIRVAPGGDVLDVVVVKSSGAPTLDASARDAVFKASPLPVPTDADEFDQFRQFKLKVKPQNIVPT